MQDENQSFSVLVQQAKVNRNEVLEVQTRISDQDLVTLTDMNFVTTLLCDRGQVTDNGVLHIASLVDLEHLRLRSSPITDRGLETLSIMKNLRALNLPQSACTEKGIKHLASLPKLTNLRLGSPHLTSETAAAVRELKGLESLHLIRVPISDDGLRLIAELPELESLYLDDCEVTADGWDWLFENHPYLHVHVNQNHLDRDPNHHRHP